MRGGQGKLHDAGDTGPTIPTVDGKLPGPDRQDGLVCFQGAITHQQADQIPLIGPIGHIGPGPGSVLAVIAQDDFVTGAQFARLDPFLFLPIAGRRTDALHQVIGRQAQRMALLGDKPENRLDAGGEEADIAALIGNAADNRRKFFADQ